MKHKAKQPEMRWSEPEGFSLEVTTAVDGFKVAAEKERSAAAAAEVAKVQGDMFPDVDNSRPCTPARIANEGGLQ